MKSIAEWDSCAAPPAMQVDEFTRGLCPYADGAAYGGVPHSFQVALTVQDTAGIPMPRLPPEAAYVTVSTDTLPPTHACLALGPVGFSESDWDSTCRFWCATDPTLFADQTTDSEGMTKVIEERVSGRARLYLTPGVGDTTGAVDTVWVNSFDLAPAIPDGGVTGPDFAAFAIGYNQWILDSLENWTCDYVYQDSCLVGDKYKPLFRVSPADFGAFAYEHTAHKDASPVTPDGCEAE